MSGVAGGANETTGNNRVFTTGSKNLSAIKSEPLSGGAILTVDPDDDGVIGEES